MGIEVGKEYKVLLSKLGFKKGDIIGVVDEDVDDDSRYCVVVNRFENRRVSKFGLSTMDLEEYRDDFYKSEVVKSEGSASKPAHYDTVIDTIAFAKANFSREQVEGFMRINAIKYLQRYEAKNGVDDVRKAVVYLNMLIEHLEEEGK